MYKNKKRGKEKKYSTDASLLGMFENCWVKSIGWGGAKFLDSISPRKKSEIRKQSKSILKNKKNKIIIIIIFWMGCLPSSASL